MRKKDNKKFKYYILTINVFKREIQINNKKTKSLKVDFFLLKREKFLNLYIIYLKCYS